MTCACMLCTCLYVYICPVFVYMDLAAGVRGIGGQGFGRSFRQVPIQLQIYYIIANIVTIYNKYS